MRVLMPTRVRKQLKAEAKVCMTKPRSTSPDLDYRPSTDDYSRTRPRAVRQTGAVPRRNHGGRANSGGLNGDWEGGMETDTVPVSHH